MTRRRIRRLRARALGGCPLRSCAAPGAVRVQTLSLPQGDAVPAAAPDLPTRTCLPGRPPLVGHSAGRARRAPRGFPCSGLRRPALGRRVGACGTLSGAGRGGQPHPPACPPSPSPSCGKVGGGDTFPSLSDRGVSALRVAGWTGTWRFARQAGAPPCVPYIPLAQGPRPTPTGSHSVQTLAGGGWGRQEPTSVSLRPARCPGAPPRKAGLCISCVSLCISRKEM